MIRLTLGTMMVVSALLVQGCTPQVPLDDLKAFVDKAGKTQPKPLAPLPPLPEYKPAQYDVTTLREPFTNPDIKVVQKADIEESDIHPDTNRPKEALEAYDLDSLSFVGLMNKGGKEFALVRDPQGALHLVAEGNYMGKNFGRVVAIRVEQGKAMNDQLGTKPPLQGQLELEEIISTSDNRWRSRPRVISMQFENN
ncbi:hypothetical protein C4K68_20860 [Pokkaliibacter plantistimulans]|uniref:Pilus assembly protein PilP n=1 Tax=Proteobacteria bacterium 228 TaxID=2083153 RepID=A0A2S5KKU1_9PROT|nr:pilus assembly protein PilP [Pokkaliibacter plantistimulans]PPC75418.1 hypothetical protein C4K68_20860 [Pokkaliibacter plantistimulans]